jgi:hypothetical protein
MKKAIYFYKKLCVLPLNSSKKSVIFLTKLPKNQPVLLSFERQKSGELSPDTVKGRQKVHFLTFFYFAVFRAKKDAHPTGECAEFFVIFKCLPHPKVRCKMHIYIILVIKMYQFIL